MQTTPTNIMQTADNSLTQTRQTPHSKRQQLTSSSLRANKPS